MNQYFGLLFARPSFFEGVSRVFDLGNTMNEYNTALTPDQTDFLALQSDINALRMDLANARRALHEANTSIEHAAE